MKPGGSKAALIQRVRHWTRERLILPLGERHPGTGRHRVYGDAAVQYALILGALADDWCADRQAAGDHENGARGARAISQAAGGRRSPLVIETYPWGPAQPYFHEGRYTTDGRAERTTVLNLTRLFAELDKLAE